MSYPTRLTSTSVVTVWPAASEDKFGRKSYGQAFTIKCTADQSYSRNLVDNRGIEFRPSLVVYAEFDGSFARPSEGDMIAIGSNAGESSPVEGSVPVKTSDIQDCGTIGDIDDIRIACGV